uniref:Uncharacterized protein n=1 Tax=Anguilla anguilla TaxID=7936 RepID=A0A0E9S350_ANGAN
MTSCIASICSAHFPSSLRRKHSLIGLLNVYTHRSEAGEGNKIKSKCALCAEHGIQPFKRTTCFCHLKAHLNA